MHSTDIIKYLLSDCNLLNPSINVSISRVLSQRTALVFWNSLTPGELTRQTAHKTRDLGAPPIIKGPLTAQDAQIGVNSDIITSFSRLLSPRRTVHYYSSRFMKTAGGARSILGTSRLACHRYSSRQRQNMSFSKDANHTKVQTFAHRARGSGKPDLAEILFPVFFAILITFLILVIRGRGGTKPPLPKLIAYLREYPLINNYLLPGLARSLSQGLGLPRKADAHIA
ncbi:hypothetical protein RRG08_022417 [Elysia crispata]|uniref:Uncharacterized protein n=1 Tax=Elysia crispata TaxID=231223 RepID=A0AAE1D8U2_9GAST|nr:hypothetical protein RRG08_022417 [Elysia crispata]